MDTEGRELLVQGKGSNKPVIILSVLLGLAVVVAGVFAYLWMDQSSKATTLQETVSSNSKEIESLKKQASDSAAEVSDTPAAVSDKTQSVSSDDDGKSIVEMVGAYAHTRVSDAHAKLSIQVTKKELPFARVSVSTEEGTGYACVLKKSDNLWVVLFCGQGTPLQSDLDAWGVPASIMQSN